MTRAPARSSEAGVTLVEMLVALAICALIGLAGFTMLDTILRSNGRAEASLDRLAALDRGFLALRRDLGGAAPESVVLTEGELRLRRDGSPVSYALAEGTLLRRIGDPPVAQRLVTEVSGVTWRALDAGGAWQDSWPPKADVRAAPRAVEAVLDLAGPGEGPLRRVFDLPSAVAR